MNISYYKLEMDSYLCYYRCIRSSVIAFFVLDGKQERRCGLYSILLLREIQGSDSRICDYAQLSGYEVMEAELSSVAEYEELVQQADIILMECKAEQFCFEICRQIREMTGKPIIVLSECNEEWEKIKMFQSGADDYLVIPYLQAELMARIRAHIERYKRLTRPFGLIEIRELKIDAFSRRVTLRGKHISMRLKEFDILLFLAQHPNQVMTKEQIYMTVWKEESGDGIYNTVAVHVKRIREKIEEDVENPKYIETVWGIGYRFLG